MNCEERKEQANLFIDGELGTTQQVDLFKHQSTFTPAKLNGQRVTVWVVIPYRFKLK